MRKYAISFFLASIFVIFNGCASLIIPVPGASFYDAKVETIYIYSPVFYKPTANKALIEKFEKEVIDILKGKGYQAFVEPRGYYGDELPAGIIADRIIPNTKADSVMIMGSEFFTLVKLSPERILLGSQVYSLSVSFWLYNRKGHRILTTPDRVFGVYFMRRANVNFAPPGSAKATAYEKVIFYETEDEFIRRMAATLTQNIPKRN